jgi:cytoplasmic FMR1 interacting protein
MLDKTYRDECDSLGIAVSHPRAHRYESLLKQRHVQVLGRPIDLNKLIAQTINSVIQNSLDIAISRFETADLTGIMVCFQYYNRSIFTIKYFHY